MTARRLARRHGLSKALAHSAMHIVGSRTLGVSQELSGVGDDAPETAGKILRSIDLILDGLERARDAEASLRRRRARR
jgi:hypothetical protein